MENPDVFSEFADLAARVRTMRDDCDRVADVLRTITVLLREAVTALADAAEPSKSVVRRRTV